MLQSELKLWKNELFKNRLSTGWLGYGAIARARILGDRIEADLTAFGTARVDSE
jgi:hypothetical protein